jgi:hypothetical protein
MYLKVQNRAAFSLWMYLIAEQLNQQYAQQGLRYLTHT